MRSLTLGGLAAIALLAFSPNGSPLGAAPASAKECPNPPKTALGKCRVASGRAVCNHGTGQWNYRGEGDPCAHLAKGRK